MANLNLSEFTEKLFVADADHTFIWDSAVSISKRVSRNSWLNSGTLTADAPVTISQTWNAVGQTFKALVVNAAGTSDANSASGSLLADFQLGGATKAKIDKLGIITANRIILDQSGSTYQLPANTPVYWTGASFLRSPSAGLFSFENNGQANFFVLAAEAANTLALRNGTSAQTFNVYGTYTSGSVYERMFMRYNGTALAFQVGAETLGATARPLQLWTSGASRLHIAGAGNVGIGTTAPGAKLDVWGNSIATISKVTSVSPGTGSVLWLDGPVGQVVTSTGNLFLTNQSVTNGIVFETNLTEKMRITAAGNVGIGTTSPTSKLQVTNGDVEIETVTSGIIMKAAGTSTRYRITLNATGDALVFTAI